VPLALAHAACALALAPAAALGLVHFAPADAAVPALLAAAAVLAAYAENDEGTVLGPGPDG